MNPIALYAVLLAVASAALPVQMQGVDDVPPEFSAGEHANAAVCVLVRISAEGILQGHATDCVNTGQQQGWGSS